MNWANRITIFRLFCIPAVLVAVGLHSPEYPGMGFAAGCVYVVAALSDWVDGVVARRFGQQSKFGALMDPLADKLLVDLTLVFLAVNPHFATTVPLWVPPVMVLRDAFITGGAYVVNQRWGPLQVKPRVLGKIATVVQGVAVPAILFEVSFAAPLLWLMVSLAVVSVIDYGIAIVRDVRSRR